MAARVNLIILSISIYLLSCGRADFDAILVDLSISTRICPNYFWIQKNAQFWYMYFWGTVASWTEHIFVILDVLMLSNLYKQPQLIRTAPTGSPLHRCCPDVRSQKLHEAKLLTISTMTLLLSKELSWALKLEPRKRKSRRHKATAAVLPKDDRPPSHATMILFSRTQDS